MQSKPSISESEKALETEEFFALERHVNDIIDLYIDSYTAYYVSYKEELLKSHRETVDELSVPIIPIADQSLYPTDCRKCGHVPC